MAISFNGIPAALRVPFVFAEFDNSKAQQGPSIQKYTALLIGQKLPAGTATALTPVTITSESQARQLFGAGSILHGQCAAYLDNDKITELRAIPQDDDGAATDATGKVTIAAGAATEDGTLQFYVAGRQISVAVSEGDDQDAVAAALAAAITAEPLSYVSAVVNGTNANEVDLTAKNGGEAGNDIDLRFNFQSTDEFPAGITGSITTAMTGGATNPDVDDAIGAMPEEQFNIISHPYLDAANLTKLENELLDRWGPIRQIEGQAFAAKIDTLANLTTLGNSRNSRNSTIIGAQAPSAPWEWGAAWAGQTSKSGAADPGRPFQTLPLIGILPPPEADRFDVSERNNLLFDGIATFKVVASQPVIERSITTFQLNDAGAADSSYLDNNTLLTLSFLRFDFRTQFLNKYSRHKLADDGTRFGPGQPVMTPKIAKGEALSLFAQWELAGLVENAEQFKRDLVVERNAADPNRLDFLLPPDLINQLRVTAAQFQFLL